MRSFIAAAVVLRVSIATAQTPEAPPVPLTVEERVQRGIELRKEGHDADALAEFREAYQMDKSPRIRAQIAVAEQALGRWVEAERGLVLVLATNDDPWIEERRKTLEQALARVRSQLGSLFVQCNVAGAELHVDGARVATLPLSDPLRLVTGTHELEVVAPGYVSSRRAIDVAANGRVHETFALTSLPEPKTLDVAASPIRSESRSPPTELHLSGVTWMSVGLLGGLLASGATALTVREINVARYNDGSRCVVGTLSREERCGGYRDTANGAEIVAIGAFSAAGLAALGAGLSLAHDFVKSRRETARIRCAPAGWGVGCEGRF